MRFIIHEMPYERPLLAGRLRYERDGVPTGAVELWRITNAVDGYRFLRVDLDAREAESGRSSLYHVTLNPAGRPEQLKFRLWGNGPEVSGSLVWNQARLSPPDRWMMLPIRMSLEIEHSGFRPGPALRCCR